MITITIETDNAAFDDRGAEVSRILRTLAKQYESSDECQWLRLYDINGNKCGTVADDGPDSPE